MRIGGGGECRRIRVFYPRNHQINIDEVWYWEISSAEVEVLMAGGCKGYCKAYFWDLLQKLHDMVDLADVSDKPSASVFGVVSTPRIVRRQVPPKRQYPLNTLHEYNFICEFYFNNFFRDLQVFDDGILM
jgi:hypothetical protein